MNLKRRPPDSKAPEAPRRPRRRLRAPSVRPESSAPEAPGETAGDDDLHSLGVGSLMMTPELREWAEARRAAEAKLETARAVIGGTINLITGILIAVLAWLAVSQVLAARYAWAVFRSKSSPGDRKEQSEAILDSVP